MQSQRNLAKFMKILMVKRLESSFHAFRLTLGRFIQSYERVIDEFQKGNVYISKKHIGKVFELLEEDDQEAIERLLEEDKAERLNAKISRPTFIARPARATSRFSARFKNFGRSSTATQSGKPSVSPAIAAKLKKASSSFSPSPRNGRLLAERIANEVEPRSSSSRAVQTRQRTRT